MRTYWPAPVLAIFLLGFAGGAVAGEPSKYYIDLAAGYVMVDDADLSDSALPGATGTLSADSGYAFGGALGRQFGSGFRAELEVNYRQNDLDDLSIAAFGLAATGKLDGDVSTLAGMANLLYDIQLGTRITPYIGGGLGLASVNVDIDSVGGTTTAFDDSEIVFAWQGMAGLRFRLTDRISIRGGYRLFSTSDPEFGTTEGEYQSHNIEAGLTYNF